MPKRWTASTCAALLTVLAFTGSSWAQGDDPFGQDPAFNQPPTGDDPFGAPAGDDPFGGSTGGSFDPFASGGGGADPFSAAPGGAQGADPFVGGGAADPFGGGGDELFGGSDPFGGGEPFGGGTGDAQNPFGAAESGEMDEQNPFADAASLDEQTVTEGAGGISQLYEFRYRTVTRWDGSSGVVRQRMTAEEAAAIDQQAIDAIREMADGGMIRGFEPGSDANSYAQWAYYYAQLNLWSQYVDDVVLAGGDTGDSAIEQVKWPGAPQEELGPDGQPLDRQAMYDENMVNYASQTSMDDQVSDIFVSPSTNEGGGPPTFPPSTIENQVIQVYNDQLQKLRDMEKDQKDFMEKFDRRLLDRKNQRIAYEYWKDNQEMLLEEFVQDWNRRYEGQVAVIGGVRYELYRPGEVPERVRRDSNVVVTDYRLTPYDILTDEGELREAARN
ncbi:hypothetical protein KQI84_18750 [bacterium]|nr:hypothetical protein [bacterium]